MKFYAGIESVATYVSRDAIAGPGVLSRWQKWADAAK